MSGPRTSGAGIQVQYVYSACVVIRTPDTSILCDPWFTDGVYDGAWYTFPRVADPLVEIGDVDRIYVSHIHPDHYDRPFLRSYLSRYGEKPILIADHAPNHLLAKMRADGFSPIVLSEPLQIGRTLLAILPHAGGPADVDSALMVQSDENGRRHTIVNANDIIFDEAMTRRVGEAAGPIDLLLCGYTGAGPWPQTYFEPDDPALPAEAARKKEAFFERYRRLVAALQPKRTLPFAGQYLLGGRLAALNLYRGVADAAEILSFDPGAVVLADGGAVIDTVTLEPSAWRREPYPQAEIDARVSEIAGRPMAYDRLISAAETDQLPLRRLLGAALQRARARSHVEADYWFALAVGDGVYGLVNARRDSTDGVAFRSLGELDEIEPLSRIEIDPRYLFGLLTHVYQWNNAEIGSGYATRRRGGFDRAAQAFLNNLAV